MSYKGRLGNVRSYPCPKLPCVTLYRYNTALTRIRRSYASIRYTHWENDGEIVVSTHDHQIVNPPFCHVISECAIAVPAYCTTKGRGWIAARHRTSLLTHTSTKSHPAGLQMQLQQNNEELTDYLKGLDDWEEEMKEKDLSLSKNQSILTLFICIFVKVIFVKVIYLSFK